MMMHDSFPLKCHSKLRELSISIHVNGQWHYVRAYKTKTYPISEASLVIALK